MFPTTVLVTLVCTLVYVTGTLHSDGPFQLQFAANPPMYVKKTGVDPGKPLFLTPYIEAGKIKEGQLLSQVGQLNGTSVKSYSVQSRQRPLLLWLQGGPGASSLFGVFVEHGPFSITKDLRLIPRKYSWIANYSVIYIDNPVGSGFSFTDDDKGYARNETDIARDLYSALLQFYQLFPQFKKNEFYASGESYAGKYIPAICYKIHMENPSAKIKINLNGMAIGDGFSAPDKMIPGYGSFMKQTGMADSRQKGRIDEMTNQMMKFIKAKDWIMGMELAALMSRYFSLISGNSQYYNFLKTNSPADQDYYVGYLALPEVRKAIHVGYLPFGDRFRVLEFIYADVLQSVEDWVIALAEANYKILFYNGQLDVVVAAPLTEAFLDQMEWSGQSDYLAAKKMIWKVPGDSDVAGYAKKAGNLHQVIVRGSGHIVPYDKPRAFFDMIDRFITGRPFDL